MSIVRAIDEYLDALSNARLALQSPSILAPFLVFGLLQVVILTLVAFFAARPVAPFMIPVVTALGGDASLHYPTHFVLLPATYRLLYLPLAATVGFALWSWGVWSMVAHHEASLRVGARPLGKAWPSILVIGVLFVGVTVALGRGLAVVTERLPEGIAARGGTLAVIALTAFVQAFLVYAPVALRLRGGGPLAAIRKSARYALHHFGATLMLVTSVLLVHLPLDGLIANPDVIAARFHPEAVFHLMIASVLLEVVTAFVLFSGTVALALREEGGMR